jgi:hypothetical protein
MPVTHRVKLHSNGPALWPEHKPLAEILELQATTPDPIWQAVYQGAPTAPGGSIFKRAWWRGQDRYDSSAENLQRMMSACIGRWISWDTALKDTNTAAYTAAVVGELRPNYQMAMREVYRERLEFPELPLVMDRLAQRYSVDGKLRGVIIEDKAFAIPSATYRDQADAFAQLIIYCENLLASGYHARGGARAAAA